MSQEVYPKLNLPDWFDDLCEEEAPVRGFLEGADVEMEDGTRYQVYFITPTRLRMELDQLSRVGEPYYAEPGLIVIPEVTLEKVKQTLRALADKRFFQKLKPL
jgi:hypothetical protein